MTRPVAPSDGLAVATTGQAASVSALTPAPHDKKRKLQLMAETETAGLMVEDNQALRRCEEVHAATQQPIAAMEAVAQCIICSDTMKQASTVSGCGPTFCRSCLHRGGFACGRVLPGVFAACMVT